MTHGHRVRQRQRLVADPDQGDSKVCHFSLHHAFSSWKGRIRRGRESLLSEGSKIIRVGREGPGRWQHGQEEGTARAWEAL